MQRRAAGHLLSILGSRVAAPSAGSAAAAADAALGPAAFGAPAAGTPYYPPGPPHARCFSAAAAEPSAAKSTTNVPLGHHSSDLSSVACHIGLGRRRDLTMREDLALWKNGATRIKLADVFRVRTGHAGCAACPSPAQGIARRSAAAAPLAGRPV